MRSRSSADGGASEAAGTDTYAAADVLRLLGVGFGPGDNVLVSGPGDCGALELGASLLGVGHGQGGDGIVMTNNGNAGRLVESYRQRTGGSAPYVLEGSSGDGSAQPDGLPADRFTRLGSPADMSGAVVGFQSYLRSVGDTRGAFLFDSLTTLLRDVETQKAYRFTNMMTGRFEAEGVSSVFVVDREEVGEKATRMFGREFDYELRLGEGEGGTEVSVHGRSNAPEGSVPYVATDGVGDIRVTGDSTELLF